MFFATARENTESTSSRHAAELTQTSGPEWMWKTTGKRRGEKEDVEKVRGKKASDQRSTDAGGRQAVLDRKGRVLRMMIASEVRGCRHNAVF